MTLRMGLLLLLLYITTMLAVCFISYQYGQAANAADTAEDITEEKIECVQANSRALAATLKKVEALAGDANAANAVLSKTIASQKIADQKTTQEIRHALSVTAPLRVDCVFDNNIMQQLDIARQRANTATTSGFDGAVRRDRAADQ